MTVGNLTGCRVLLVEDEFIVALDIAEVLRENGCEVIGPAGTVESALVLARKEDLDVALLDINVAGDRIDPVAEALQSRGIPIILATGYSEASLPKDWRHLPRLTKPFRRAQLKRLIESVRSR